MCGFLYDLIMYYGPVVIVGVLTLEGVKMNLRHNEKMAFYDTYASKKNMLEDTEASVSTTLHYIKQLDDRKYQLKHLKEAEEMLIPMMQSILNSTEDVSYLRKKAISFKGRNQLAGWGASLPSFKEDQINDLEDIKKELKHQKEVLEKAKIVHDKAMDSTIFKPWKSFRDRK